MMDKVIGMQGIFNVERGIRMKKGRTSWIIIALLALSVPLLAGATCKKEGQANPVVGETGTGSATLERTRASASLNSMTGRVRVKKGGCSPC